MRGKTSKEREAIRQRYDDAIRVLQLYQECLKAEIEAVEANLRLLECSEETIEEQEQAPQMGIPMQEMQGLVRPERGKRRSHKASGLPEIVG
jgi:hypothetical protein